MSRDRNVKAVQRKLRDRERTGLRKYGVTTERGDLTLLDWLNHLQQELMDAAVYAEVLIQRVEAKPENPLYVPTPAQIALDAEVERRRSRK